MRRCRCGCGERETAACIEHQNTSHVIARCVYLAPLVDAAPTITHPPTPGCASPARSGQWAVCSRHAFLLSSVAVSSCFKHLWSPRNHPPPFCRPPAFGFVHLPCACHHEALLRMDPRIALAVMSGSDRRHFATSSPGKAPYLRIFAISVELVATLCITQPLAR